MKIANKICQINVILMKDQKELRKKRIMQKWIMILKEKKIMMKLVLSFLLKIKLIKK